jgi:hypothetical protein
MMCKLLCSCSVSLVFPVQELDLQPANDSELRMLVSINEILDLSGMNLVHEPFAENVSECVQSIFDIGKRPLPCSALGFCEN